MLQKMIWTQFFCLLWSLSFHLAVIQFAGIKKVIFITNNSTTLKTVLSQRDLNGTYLVSTMSPSPAKLSFPWF